MAKAQNEAWGLGYLDLYLIHFPVALEYIEPEKLRYPVSACLPLDFRTQHSPQLKAWWMDNDHKTITLDRTPLQETWQALEEVVDVGIAKSIGISNAQAQTLYDLQSYARHPCSALQIEHHPYLVQPELVAMAQESNITITAYSSFGPQSFLEMPPIFRERAKDISLLFDVNAVTAPAKRLNVTPAQVLLRWATQRNIAVIPKSNNVTRLQQNLDVTSFELTEEEIKAISALDKGLRFNDPGFYLDQPLRIFA